MNRWVCVQVSCFFCCIVLQSCDQSSSLSRNFPFTITVNEGYANETSLMVGGTDLTGLSPEMFSGSQFLPAEEFSNPPKHGQSNQFDLSTGKYSILKHNYFKPLTFLNIDTCHKTYNFHRKML